MTPAEELASLRAQLKDMNDRFFAELVAKRNSDLAQLARLRAENRALRGAVQDSIRHIKDALAEGIPGASRSPDSYWVECVKKLQAVLAQSEPGAGKEEEEK